MSRLERVHEVHVLDHTCNDVDHSAAVTFTRRVQLGDGRDRLEGQRCDGTPIHHVTERAR